MVAKLWVLLTAAGIGVIAFGTASVSRAADLTAAKQNFQTFCVKCHGESGTGDGPSAATLSKRPADFTECARMQKLSDDFLFNVIKDGGKANGLSDEMKGWKDGFEDDEMHGLVAYIRSFCAK